MTKRKSAATGRHHLALIAAALTCAAGTVSAADGAETGPTLGELKKMLLEQTQRLDALRKQMQAEEARLNQIRDKVGIERLETMRAAGPGEKTPARTTVAQAQQQQTQQPVGVAPTEKEETAPVAQIFDQPGVLTPPGTYILEPSLQYSYSASNRVALVGYTIIPALAIGLIDVREVKRNTWTAALTARTGLTNRMEVEAKIPYVYRTDDTIRRPLATASQTQAGSSIDQLFNADGQDIGDIEFSARYQLNVARADEPIYIASLRFKTRTGSDQFDSTNVSVPGFGPLLKDLPTGSGFYSLQPGITFLFPSDPVIFFGGVNYQYSFERDVDIKQEVNGTITSEMRTVQPGGVFVFNFGMGLALNNRSSFSVGYDHASVGIAKIDGEDDRLGVRVQLGTLMFGYAYRFSPKTSLNVSLGVGVTRDTPDLTLTVRLPMTL